MLRSEVLSLQDPRLEQLLHFLSFPSVSLIFLQLLLLLVFLLIAPEPISDLTFLRRVSSHEQLGIFVIQRFLLHLILFCPAHLLEAFISSLLLCNELAVLIFDDALWTGHCGHRFVEDSGCRVLFHIRVGIYLSLHLLLYTVVIKLQVS